MARTICVINNKGGVGKTNVSVNLSSFLAAYGKRVLLVDFDHQANASFSVGLTPRTLSLSVYHALLETVEPEQVIRNTSIMGFDIMPASPDLAGAEIELVDSVNREFKLAKLLEKVEDNYDFILVDTPPSLGILTLNALCAVDEILIPLQAEYLALEGLNQLTNTINLVEENIGHEFKSVSAVMTMYSRTGVLSRKVFKEIKNTFKGYIFDTAIPRSVVLAEAPKTGKTILQFAPTSKAAHAYKMLAREILAQENKEEKTFQA